MGKRKLDEFLELAKDLSASDIAESLKALGPQKCRRIVSDPKLLQNMKDLQARTTPQMYTAFKYLLNQRKWGINNPEEEREFWFTTMEILDLPCRNQVKFLDRTPFLRALEHAMLVSYQFQFLRKEEETNESKKGITGMQWPTYAVAVDDYRREHPTYQDSPFSYESWLNHEDRELDMKQFKADQERRERLERFTQMLQLQENEQPMKALDGYTKL